MIWGCYTSRTYLMWNLQMFLRDLSSLDYLLRNQISSSIKILRSFWNCTNKCRFIKKRKGFVSEKSYLYRKNKKKKSKDKRILRQLSQICFHKNPLSIKHEYQIIERRKNYSQSVAYQKLSNYKIMYVQAIKEHKKVSKDVDSADKQSIIDISMVA